MILLLLHVVEGDILLLRQIQQEFVVNVLVYLPVTTPIHGRIRLEQVESLQERVHCLVRGNNRFLESLKSKQLLNPTACLHCCVIQVAIGSDITRSCFESLRSRWDYVVPPLATPSLPCK
jgi:hypothetical protein